MLEAVEHCAQGLLDAGIEEHKLWPISRPELNVEEISEESRDDELYVRDQAGSQAGRI